MPTYSTLREHILLALDINPSTTNDDTVDLVNHRMKQVVDNLVAEYRPVSLLVEATFEVDSATTSIALGSGGFEVTDFAECFALSVDPQTSATRADFVWDYVSRENWILSRSYGYGDELSTTSWTVDGNENYYLSQWPDGSDLWDVYLHYYKQTAAVADAGIPELPVEHQQALIVSGTVLGFPHRFQGDRQITLLMYQKEFDDAKKRLMASRKPQGQDIQLKSRNVSRAGSLSWPAFQES